MKGKNNEDEDERTSLLASSSAPRPSLANPFNPRSQPQQQQQKPSSRRQTITATALEEMERGAKRLADYSAHGSGMGDENDDDDDSNRNLPDSDSVNGLLAGFSDDEASVGSIGRLEDASKTSGPVTQDDLNYLTRKSSSGGDASSNEAEAEMREPSFHAQQESSDSVELSNRVHQSTRALRASTVGLRKNLSYGGGPGMLKKPPSHPEIEPSFQEEDEEGTKKLVPKPMSLTGQVLSLVALTLLAMLVLAAALALGTIAVGPPRQPLGEYRILEAQVGEQFWQYYEFYAGKDSVGSNGYITYVSKEDAMREGIIEVITEQVPPERMVEIYEDGDPRAEEDWLAEDLEFLEQLRRKKEEEEEAAEKEEEEEKKKTSKTKQKMTKKAKDEQRRRLQPPQTPHSVVSSDIPPPRLEPFNPDLVANATGREPPTETFVRISSSPTPLGPRNSVRLEGKRRFNRGLFIIDLRHMPAGCGTWPAFWLTDEANWPVNGEIDIVEGVNYQDTAKTALHTTQTCDMDDVPEGTKTGSWDTAVGIPNRKTGIPDMTFRWANNCFVYDPHQWINQGCVATDLKTEGRSLGVPLNANGGGVYALEWDPVYRHIRTWVFSPHGRVPSNLREAMRTALEEDVGKRVAPDTDTWGLPYGHFPIGEGTNCPSGHFRNMRLVINLAFCGSVSGNRYFMDCPKQFKKFKTCNEWVASNPEELKEAYWKIRGVYVYEREWERQWT